MTTEQYKTEFVYLPVCDYLLIYCKLGGVRKRWLGPNVEDVTEC